MKVKKIREGIYQLDYPNQEALAKAMIRFQEHYESPKFRNEIFTLGQFREWYCQEYGGFTYYEDWNGFNFPSHILDNFHRGLFDPLTEEEQKVLSVLPGSRETFYVIGTHGGGDDNVLEHEICHGTYYNNPDYRDAINKELAKYEGQLNDVHEWLLKIGYCEAVLDDETHAYVGVDYKYLEEKGIKYPEKLRDGLIKIRTKFGV